MLDINNPKSYESEDNAAEATEPLTDDDCLDSDDEHIIYHDIS